MICLVCLSFLYTFEFQMACISKQINECKCECKISYNVWFSIDKKKTFKYESFCMSLISGYIFTQDI